MFCVWHVRFLAAQLVVQEGSVGLGSMDTTSVGSHLSTAMASFLSSKEARFPMRLEYQGRTQLGIEVHRSDCIHSKNGQKEQGRQVIVNADANNNCLCTDSD